MGLTPRETARLAEIERDLLARYPDLAHAFTVPAIPAQVDRAFEASPVLTRPPVTNRAIPASCAIAPATVAWRARRGPGEWLVQHGIALVLAVATALAMIMWVLPGTAGRL